MLPSDSTCAVASVYLYICVCMCAWTHKQFNCLKGLENYHPTSFITQLSLLAGNLTLFPINGNQRQGLVWPKVPKRRIKGLASCINQPWGSLWLGRQGDFTAVMWWKMSLVQVCQQLHQTLGCQAVGVVSIKVQRKVWSRKKNGKWPHSQEWTGWR